MTPSRWYTLERGRSRLEAIWEAAMGPRLDASSLRMRRVFSAAGTFEGTLAAARGSDEWVLSAVLMAGTVLLDSCVRYPVLKLAPWVAPFVIHRPLSCLEYQTWRIPAGQQC